MDPDGRVTASGLPARPLAGLALLAVGALACAGSPAFAVLLLAQVPVGAAALAAALVVTVGTATVVAARRR
ncbi:MAG: hypothetical protein KY433_08725 [Actinobacteria bacterium]|nr:hypothetical protein [Actinomycetota bacterium]